MAMFITFICFVLAVGQMTQGRVIHVNQGRVKRSDDIIINPLTAVVEKLSAQVNGLVARLGSLETRQGSLDTRQGSLDTKLRTMDSKQHTMDSKLASQQRHAAFMAHFSKDSLTAPLHTAMKFNQVDFNDGNAYHASQGVFIAPFNGVYTFSTQIYTDSREWTLADIMVNGNKVSRMGLDSNGHEQNLAQSGLTTVVVKLKQGDKVWVQTDLGSDFLGGFHSFFNGALLYTY